MIRHSPRVGWAAHCSRSLTLCWSGYPRALRRSNCKPMQWLHSCFCKPGKILLDCSQSFLQNQLNWISAELNGGILHRIALNLNKLTGQSHFNVLTVHAANLRSIARIQQMRCAGKAPQRLVSPFITVIGLMGNGSNCGNYQKCKRILRNALADTERHHLQFYACPIRIFTGKVQSFDLQGLPPYASLCLWHHSQSRYGRR